MDVERIGLDTSKAVFTLHGVDHAEKIVLRRNLGRAEMEAFFAKLPPALVALEACGGSHHWGRRLLSLGHTVRLIPPQYVKPFVRRGKNGRNDAEAVSEAAARPGMPGVPVRSAEQQAEAMVLSARELLVRQRTRLVNAARGHAAEFGVVAAKGISQLPAPGVTSSSSTACTNRIAAPGADAAPPFPQRPLDCLTDQIKAIDAAVAALVHAHPPLTAATHTPQSIGAVTAAAPLAPMPELGQLSRHQAAALAGLAPHPKQSGARNAHRRTKAGRPKVKRVLVMAALSASRYNPNLASFRKQLVANGKNQSSPSSPSCANSSSSATQSFASTKLRSQFDLALLLWSLSCFRRRLLSCPGHVPLVRRSSGATRRPGPHRP